MKKALSLLLSIVVAVAIVGSAAIAQSFKYGDVNGDSKINSTDALEVLNFATGTQALSEDGKKAADVDANSAINSSDALMILQFSTGLRSTFPVEENETKDPETAQEILDYYKSIAAKNSEISCKQSFKLVKIELGLASALVRPVVDSALSAVRLIYRAFQAI